MSDGMFDFCDMPVVIFEGLLLGRQLRFWAAAEAELPFPAKALCEIRRLRHEDFDEDLLLNSMCGSVFDTVQLLCEHLSTLPPPRRALELGAGVGLPGLWLASGSPARVVLSDCQPGVLRLLAENVELNDLQGRAVAQRLRWGEEVEDSFDLVLGSDILQLGQSDRRAAFRCQRSPVEHFCLRIQLSHSETRQSTVRPSITQAVPKALLAEQPCKFNMDPPNKGGSTTYPVPPECGLVMSLRTPSAGPAWERLRPVKVILQHAAANGLRWVNSCDLGALQQSEAI
ncbi:unnamed protein product [Effrenium voratum]|nr:unnamed protein product [Effrenium voratum]